MSKKQDISKLTNILCKSLRHKIGSIVNPDEFYATKYAKDSEVILKEAKKVVIIHNWNTEDKKKIKQFLSKRLKKELEEKDFIDDKKFEIMAEETNKILKELNLN